MARKGAASPTRRDIATIGEAVCGDSRIDGARGVESVRATLAPLGDGTELKRRSRGEAGRGEAVCGASRIGGARGVWSDSDIAAVRRVGSGAYRPKGDSPQGDRRAAERMRAGR